MKTKFNPQRAFLLVIIGLLFYGINYYIKWDGSVSQIIEDSPAVIEGAFRARQKDIQVSGSGEVVKLLPDDLKGSRHQKFIVKLSPGLTILIAHNIDLAPRIDNLQKGDTIAFAGEYEYNERGGIVHWTHHDPGKKHPDGWLKHKGHIYK